MATVYADRPFAPIPSPLASLPKNEKPDSFVLMATEMANVHNFIIRGLNAIYVQAPYIPPSNTPLVRSFLHYIHQWYRCIHVHHTGEEETFFPTIERRTGVKGIMDGNIAQHAQFEGGIEELNDYVQLCLASSSSSSSSSHGTEEKRIQYDGTKIVNIINNFGAVLRQHLADEIPTILSLREYKDQLVGLDKEFAQEGGKAMQELGLFAGGVFVMTSHDIGYEGGLHRSFPPAPRVVVWVLRNIAYWVHRSWWEFAPCDRLGRLKELKYVEQRCAGKAGEKVVTVEVVGKGN